MCEGTSLMTLGLIKCNQAHWAAGQSYAEQALPLARGDSWIEGWTHAVIGHAAVGQGAFELARAALEAGLALARQQGSPPNLAPFILDNLAEVEAASGQPNQAHAWLVKSLEVRRDNGERLGIGDSLERLAALASACRQPERAVRLAGAADALYEQLGIRRSYLEETRRVAIEFLKRGLGLLGDLTGEAPIGFRAPSWSVDHRTPWFCEELEAQGAHLNIFSVGSV